MIFQSLGTLEDILDLQRAVLGLFPRCSPHSEGMADNLENVIWGKKSLFLEYKTKNKTFFFSETDVAGSQPC